jgi:lysophospholipase L1-like esterase
MVRKLLQKVFILLIGIFIGLLIGEILVRIFVSDRILPQITYKLNNHNFRDINHEKEKPKDTIRIAFIGDSMTFGQGVKLSENFPNVTGELLKKNTSPGTKVEIFNFGVRGADTLREYSILKNQALKYEPDMLILGFVLNDFADGPTTQKYVQSIKRESEGYKIFKSLEKVSKLAHFLDWAFSQVFSDIKDIRKNFLNTQFSQKNSSYKPMKEHLGMMLDIMKERKGILLYFPYLMQDEEKTYFYTKAKTMVKGMCEERGIDFIEVLPSLKHKPFYKWWATPGDHHPNAEAHSIIAGLIEKAILKKDLL